MLAPSTWCSTSATLGGVASEITQLELRINSAEIMRKLDLGETFAVIRNGVPVGELTPLRRQRFVNAQVALSGFRGAPKIDADQFRADLDSATPGR